MVEYREAKNAVAGLFGSGDWPGVCSYVLDYLGYDAEPVTGVGRACLDAVGDDAGILEDLAVALAFAGDVLPDGARVSGTYDPVLGLLCAVCVRYYTDRAQGANMAFLGAHGWSPGEGTGGQVMDGMAADASRAVSDAGLSGFVPSDVQDGFRELAREPYDGAVPVAVLHRALASTGMPAPGKLSVAGRLLYGRVGRGRVGNGMRDVLSCFFRVGAMVYRGPADGAVSALARACTYGAALAAGRGADAGEYGRDVAVLLEGLGNTAGIDRFMAACRGLA